MIVEISRAIVRFISSNTDIDNNMVEVYQYGVEITISSILNIVLILLCGLITGDLMCSLVFLMCFIPIRSYCGGYHARTYFKCNLIFVITFLFVVLLYRFFENMIGYNIFVYLAVALIAFIPIVVFSPVKNANKKLTALMTKKSRCISIILCLLSTCLAMYLIHCKINYGIVVIVTVAAVSVMIMVEIFMQRRGYHEV